MHWTDDLATLVALKKAYLAVDPEGPPTVSFVAGRESHPARVGILPSSFNPPTEAHLALGEAARSALNLETVVLSYGRVIVDKPLSGLWPEDRLLALVAIQKSRPKLGVAIASSGLYVDLARAYEAAFPRAERYFLVGFDKIEQIFDPRYYKDRDEALRQLFARARFAVAARAGKGGEALRALLQKPENQPFAPFIQEIPIDPAFADISSTKVRQEASRGIFHQEEIPHEIIPLLQRTGVYRAPEVKDGEEIDAYALRGLILDLACQSPEAKGDLRPILEKVLAPENRALREKLRQKSLSWEELVG